MRLSFSFTIILSSLIPFLVNSFSWNRKRFKSEGLINLNQLGLEHQDGIILAMGDSNADQLYVIPKEKSKAKQWRHILIDLILFAFCSQDLFILSSDQRSIHLYLWNRGTPYNSISQEFLSTDCSVFFLRPIFILTSSK